MTEVTRAELARQVVVNLAAGAASGYAGPLAGTAAAGGAPVVLVAMDYIAAAIGREKLSRPVDQDLFATAVF